MIRSHSRLPYDREGTRCRQLPGTKLLYFRFTRPHTMGMANIEFCEPIKNTLSLLLPNKEKTTKTRIYNFKTSIKSSKCKTQQGTAPMTRTTAGEIKTGPVTWPRVFRAMYHQINPPCNPKMNLHAVGAILLIKQRNIFLSLAPRPRKHGPWQ